MKKLFCLLAFTVTFAAQAQVKITYIANEGVLIESAEKKVIIDALFDKYYDEFHHPSESLLEKMISGEAPYNDVDLLLSTHVHRDHFAPTMAGRFLNGHKETRMVASAQMAKSLAEDYAEGASVTNQVEGIVLDSLIHEREVNGIKVKAFFIKHAGGSRFRKIENMGFVIEIGGKRILHLGDSDMNAERFAALDLKSMNIDIALIPYWSMLEDPGVSIIKNSIQPKHLLAIHFPKVGSPPAEKAIAGNLPDAKILKEVFEEHSY